jgi:stearoyl-CoA desaturase (delta-9 desaturase)
VLIKHFDWWMLLLGYMLAKIFNMLGHEIGMHRLWSHKSFRTSKIKELLLHVFSFPILFGSTIVYAGVHRDHHKYADTENDPHLESLIDKLFYIRKVKYKISPKSVYDLIKNPIHKFLHEYYLRINFLILLIFLILFGPVITGYTLSFVVTYMWLGGLMINSLGHNPSLGYRNVDTPDKSTNNYILQFLFPGLGLHNNHHAYPGNYKLTIKNSEMDFCGWIIEKFFIKHE